LNSKISEKDKKDWQKFIDSNDPLENKDYNSENQKYFRSEISIDLHGYSLIEANQVIDNLIKKSSVKKINKITVITGKGLRSKNFDNPYKSTDLGILKYSVPNYVKNNSELMSLIKEIDFQQVDDLNSGSFSIFLKKL
jgi:DNA-nicking Smr family endonuclease|tara:strand:- start:287 stop:700 length:414 start_codon:yes stop_codon:yes gene_type:complete